MTQAVHHCAHLSRMAHRSSTFWISITALVVTCQQPGDARPPRDRRGGGQPWGQPRLPVVRRAVFAQRSAKNPVVGTSTLSPGEKRFAMLASQAPLQAACVMTKPASSRGWASSARATGRGPHELRSREIDRGRPPGTGADVGGQVMNCQPCSALFSAISLRMMPSDHFSIGPRGAAVPSSRLPRPAMSVGGGHWGIVRRPFSDRAVRQQSIASHRRRSRHQWYSQARWAWCMRVSLIRGSRALSWDGECSA